MSSKLVKVSKYSIIVVLLTIPLFGLVDAGSTRVFLDPQTQTVDAIGNSFTINVRIADVSNLYGYDFKLFYDSTVMNGTKALKGSFLESSGTTIFLVRNLTDHYDSTQGFLWITCSLMGPSSGSSGSGVLATIQFNSVAATGSTLLHLQDSALSDNTGSPIPHDVANGTVTIIPEFTSLAMLLALIVVSLFILVFRKKLAHPSHNLTRKSMTK
jgi:hypothetical protein